MAPAEWRQELGRAATFARLGDTEAEAAARKRSRELRIEDKVRRVLAESEPLSDEVRERIAGLLKGSER